MTERVVWYPVISRAGYGEPKSGARGGLTHGPLGEYNKNPIADAVWGNSLIAVIKVSSYFETILIPTMTHTCVLPRRENQPMLLLTPMME